MLAGVKDDEIRQLIAQNNNVTQEWAVVTR